MAPVEAANTQVKGEFGNNWSLLIPCFAGIMLCAVHGYSLGVMIGPLEKEFGWSRAEISSGMLITAVIALVASPLVGTAVDRVGPRRIALTGVLAYCGALAALSLTGPSIVSWWLLWTLVGAANALILPTVWVTAISSRFSRHRGKALAIALCGTGLSGALVPILMIMLLEAWGWRGAYIGLGAIFAATVFPVAFVLLRVSPDCKIAESARKLSPSVGTGTRYSPAFVKLAFAAILFALTVSALSTNAFPLLLAEGLDRQSAAAMVSFIGLGAVIGRLGGGYLLDRFDARKVAATSALLPILAASALLATEGSIVTAGAACFIVGLSAGGEVDACAYLAGRYFGLENFGRMFGTINGFVIFASGLGPIAANYVFDLTKNYEIVLWAQIPAILVSALLFLVLGAYPAFPTAPSQTAR